MIFVKYCRPNLRSLLFHTAFFGGNLYNKKKEASCEKKDLKAIKGQKSRLNFYVFDVLLTVHLCIFISVNNQHDAQIFVLQKVYFMPLHVSSTCAHHQVAKTALHSLWYHHTYRFDDTRGCVMQF